MMDHTGPRAKCLAGDCRLERRVRRGGEQRHGRDETQERQARAWPARTPGARADDGGWKGDARWSPPKPRPAARPRQKRKSRAPARSLGLSALRWWTRDLSANASSGLLMPVNKHRAKAPKDRNRHEEAAEVQKKLNSTDGASGGA